MVKAIAQIDRREDGRPSHTIYGHILPRDGVCAGMVSVFNLLNACTMRHPPVAFLTQNVGLECGEMLSRTCPAFLRRGVRISRGATAIVDVNVVEIGWSEVAKGAELGGDNAIESRRGVGKALRHDKPFPEHAAGC